METTAYLTAVADTSAMDRLMGSRRTVRAFRPDAVPRELLAEVIAIASRAPSTFNTQPWKVYVLTGRRKRQLSEAILGAHVADSEPAFSPFPEPSVAECSERQHDFGRRYYASLGIARYDTAARARQTGRNFEFFGAPIGLIFAIHADLTRYSWVDCGLFMQNLMLAAHARGLATCPQVAFVRYEAIIKAQLALSAKDAVICGMSLGYPDERAPVNQVAMPREPLAQFSRWLGFVDD